MRALATMDCTNKRKRSEPFENEQLAHEVSPEIQQLEKLPTFQEQGAEGVQCSWCEKWRWLCPAFHIVPQATEEDGCTTFECHELLWHDGTSVGLSCESYEQDFHPPNPKDKFAKHVGRAETEMKNFFDWWTKSSDTPTVDESDISLYRDHYWEYLAHIGTLVPEGFADHPKNTLKVEDLGK